MKEQVDRRDEMPSSKARIRYSSKSHTANPAGPHFGHTICFTGTLPMRREDAAKGAALLGYQPVPSVTAKTDVLVVGDQPKGRGSSRKEQNAAKHGVRTITGAEFAAMAEAAGTDSPRPPLAAERKPDAVQEPDLLQGDS